MIISDIEIPVDGYEMVRRIRETDGLNNYIKKPFGRRTGCAYWCFVENEAGEWEPLMKVRFIGLVKIIHLMLFMQY